MELGKMTSWFSQPCHGALASRFSCGAGNILRIFWVTTFHKMSENSSADMHTANDKWWIPQIFINNLLYEVLGLSWIQRQFWHRFYTLGLGSREEGGMLETPCLPHEISLCPSLPALSPRRLAHVGSIMTFLYPVFLGSVSGRHPQYIRGQEEREARVFIPPAPYLQGCHLATSVLLFSRPQLQSGDPFLVLVSAPSCP